MHQVEGAAADRCSLAQRSRKADGHSTTEAAQHDLLLTTTILAIASSTLSACPMAIRMAAAVTALRPWPCIQ